MSEPHLSEPFCKIIRHPVLSHNLTKLRDAETRPMEFRRVLEQLSSLMAYEVTRDLGTTATKISTPLEDTESLMVSDDLAIVTIMRAGNGMLDGLLHMLPFSRVGHIGIYRDKFTRQTVEYYFRLPEQIKGRTVLLADPLIATGDTAVAAIDRLKEYGVGTIRCVSVLAAPEGLVKLHESHPDLEVYTLSVERQLNEMGYILPGLGDAGDRLYGTHI